MNNEQAKANYHIRVISNHINYLLSILPPPTDLRSERFRTAMDRSLCTAIEGMRLFCHYSEGYFEVNDGE